MAQSAKGPRYPALYFFYTLFAMASGIYLAFINVYLYSLGFSNMDIGLFSAIVPIAALGLQMLFGLVADRVRLKNTVAIVLLIALVLVSGLFLFTRGRPQIAILMSAWTGLHAGLLAISTAIILENMSAHGQEGRFGRVRLAYSLGYALPNGLLGWLFNRSIIWMFPSVMVFAAMAMVPLIMMPKSRGVPDTGVRVPWTRIFSYRRLMALFAVSVLLCISNGFVYTYMPVYFMEVGGNSELYGYAVLLMTAVETPFLLASGWLIRRFGIEKLLVVPMVSLMVRWALISAFPNPWVIVLSNMLHGTGFIVLHLTLARYVADQVEPGLQATGQTMVNVALYSISRAVSGLLGGWLTQSLGIRRTFAINAGYVAVVLVCYLLLLGLWRRREGEKAAPGA